MQKLLLAEDVFDALQEGKRTTIRKGRRDIQLGELLFESTEKKRIVFARVLRLQYCRLGDVYLYDLQNDGFEDHTDMAEQMKRFYPDITMDSEVTVISFNL